MAAELFLYDVRGRRGSRPSIGHIGDEYAARRRRSSVVDGVSIVNVIRKKRDDEELNDNEIQWFVSSATNGLITEAQIGMNSFDAV